MRPDPSDARWFRQVLGQYPTGVCVVTAKEPSGQRVGFVVGSFSSISLDPPLIGYFPDKGSTSWPRIESAARFCVNVLAADQEDLCRRFAFRAPDKFDGLTCRETAGGSPILDGVVSWIDCDLESVSETGDHFFVVGRVRDLDVDSASLPLLFFQGGYGSFEPRSLAAPDRSGVLTAQLRHLDMVRGEMEWVADAVDGRCVAAALTGDELAILASAGGSHTTSVATLVGQSIPFRAPAGFVVAPWIKDPSRWLRGVPDAEHETWMERLATVRRRGFSVGLLNRAQRSFAATLDRLAARPGSVSPAYLEGLLRDLAYDPAQLTPEVKKDIRVISAPVFDAHGQVALALTVYGFPRPPADRGVDAYIDCVCTAARRATEHLGGRPPDD